MQNKKAFWGWKKIAIRNDNNRTERSVGNSTGNTTLQKEPFAQISLHSEIQAESLSLAVYILYIERIAHYTHTRKFYNVFFCENNANIYEKTEDISLSI